MSPSFTCNLLYDVNNVYGDAGSDQCIDLEEHLARFRLLTTEYPEWRLKSVSQNTEADEKNGGAEMFQVLEVTGHPPGLVTHTIIVLDFQFWEGRWLCLRKRAARGVEIE